MRAKIHTRGEELGGWTQSASKFIHTRPTNGKAGPGRHQNDHSDTGFTIRGLAGPYVVVGSNFAPGTSSEDVKSAMESVVGEIQSCRIITASPTVIVEMVFADKGSAEAVIAKFNNQKVKKLIANDCNALTLYQ